MPFAEVGGLGPRPPNQERAPRPHEAQRRRKGGRSEYDDEALRGHLQPDERDDGKTDSVDRQVPECEQDPCRRRGGRAEDVARRDGDHERKTGRVDDREREPGRETRASA